MVHRHMALRTYIVWSCRIDKVSDWQINVPKYWFLQFSLYFYTHAQVFLWFKCQHTTVLFLGCHPSIFFFYVRLCILLYSIVIIKSVYWLSSMTFISLLLQPLLLLQLLLPDPDLSILSISCYHDLLFSVSHFLFFTPIIMHLIIIRYD